MRAVYGIFLGIFFILGVLFRMSGIEKLPPYMFILTASVILGVFYIGECIDELKKQMR